MIWNINLRVHLVFTIIRHSNNFILVSPRCASSPKWPKPGIDCLLDSQHFENPPSPYKLYYAISEDNLELEKVMLGYDQMV